MTLSKSIKAYSNIEKTLLKSGSLHLFCFGATKHIHGFNHKTLQTFGSLSMLQQSEINQAIEGTHPEFKDRYGCFCRFNFRLQPSKHENSIITAARKYDKILPEQSYNDIIQLQLSCVFFEIFAQFRTTNEIFARIRSKPNRFWVI